jgi:Uma2 family endonuclease
MEAQNAAGQPVSEGFDVHIVSTDQRQTLKRGIVAITRHSVDDYEELIRIGVLTERDRVELIRGEIVPKMAIGPRHSTCVTGFNQRLIERAAGRAVVGIHDPVRLPDSEPEPDISLVRPPKDRYLTRHPEPADIFLIVEVSDSSLDDDRNVMRPLYAEAGIDKFWIANLRDDCLEVHRGPQPDGTYQETRVSQRGQSTDIAALPGLVVAVDEVL